MARVTVEDCVGKVRNRFELVALAAQRTKDINSGGVITVDRDNDKDPVVALREIAAGHVNTDTLREELIRRLQARSTVDYVEDENLHVDSEPEDFEYIADGSDLHISDDHSDLDNEMFDDDVIEGNDNEL